MVEVRGFDSGKFWNVQSLSIVICTGSGCLLPSITPKYGGSLQNFSTPSAGEAVPSNRANRIGSVKPSVEPRGFRAIGSGVLFNFRATSKSANRPGMPAGLSRDGAGTGGFSLVQRGVEGSGGA